MRGFPKPIAAVSLVVIALGLVVLAGAGHVASAQQSADSIINALKPNGNQATRGIRFGTGVPQAPSPARPASTTTSAPRPATAHSATPPREEVPAQVAGPSVNVTVNFPSGSAELSPQAKASLGALGKALASNDLATFRFRIEGHTDNVGSREENLALSQQRAEAVVTYLATQFNVAPARLEAVGMGQEHPLIETPPQTPEARNRRVQVINLGT
jgi:OmpA-OmpF porin, OOP family